MPNPQTIDHVKETLELLSVMGDDHRFIDAYNENKEKSAEGSIHTMSDALNTIIVRETEKAKILTLIDLVEDGSLSIEKAAEKAGMTVKQLKELMDKAPLQTV